METKLLNGELKYRVHIRKMVQDNFTYTPGKVRCAIEDLNGDSVAVDEDKDALWVFTLVDKECDYAKYDGCVSLHRTFDGAKQALYRQVKDDCDCGIIDGDLEYDGGMVWHNERMTYIISAEEINE